uniref:Uncharacterized protein n=1 Tax=Knipowitschia caucasica TaxID=637954 RepID=A0AAV2JLW8_KNICA
MSMDTQRALSSRRSSFACHPLAVWSRMSRRGEPGKDTSITSSSSDATTHRGGGGGECGRGRDRARLGRGSVTMATTLCFRPSSTAVCLYLYVEPWFGLKFIPISADKKN